MKPTVCPEPMRNTRARNKLLLSAYTPQLAVQADCIGCTSCPDTAYTVGGDTALPRVTAALTPPPIIVGKRRAPYSEWQPHCCQLQMSKVEGRLQQPPSHHTLLCHAMNTPARICCLPCADPITAHSATQHVACTKCAGSSNLFDIPLATGKHVSCRQPKYHTLR